MGRSSMLCVLLVMLGASAVHAQTLGQAIDSLLGTTTGTRSSCPVCQARSYLSVRVCRPMTLFIRTTNPSTRRQIDANWDFTRSLPLNTWVPLRLNNQLIEGTPGNTLWRQPGQDWMRMNMLPDPISCSGPCPCCRLTQRYTATFGCGATTGRSTTGGSTTTPLTLPRMDSTPRCPTCRPQNFLTVKVCQPQQITISGRDTRNRPFQSTWDFDGAALNQARQLSINGADLEIIDSATVDWRNSTDDEWQKVNMTALNDCSGGCPCCRRGWSAEWDCTSTSGSSGGTSSGGGTAVARLESVPTTAPNTRPAAGCPTCTPTNRLRVRVCKNATFSIRSRDPRTGQDFVTTHSFTQSAQLNVDTNLTNDDVPIEIDPARTDYRFDGDDWTALKSTPMTGTCEGLCNCCGVLLYHYARFYCQ